MTERKKERIAIVIVHGMGEQRPMDTLRSFVDGIHHQMVKIDSRESKSKIRSKPDSIGDIYETTRMSLESNFETKRPIVDFYEFYWAHNMRGTEFSNTFTWLKKVALTWVSRVPPRLKQVWYTVWTIFLIVFVLVYFLFPYIQYFKELAKIVASVFAGAVVTFIWTYFAKFLKASFLKSLGDVARYMTPAPDNIAERSTIRRQGITFLKKLHSINNRKSPTRIMVVAHSLGTVVAYDLLRLLWTEYNISYGKPRKTKQSALAALNVFALDPEIIAKDDFSLFKDAQRRCFDEARDLGNPWLISDFITLGAAVYALDYLTVNKVSSDVLKTERELPVCPPQIDEKDKAFFFKGHYQLPDSENFVDLNVMHHGALFGPTRWTNIFYSSDFVGGPMQRIFGKGVEDICIKRSSFWFYPGGHLAYWNKEDKNNALAEIVKALRLGE